MDEELVKRYNAVVGPNDKCYFLGDVVINRKALKTVNRLNGDKVLIKGNHDIFRLQDYIDAGFRDIRAYHVMNGLILSHVPVHHSQLERFGTNVHGHLHANRVRDKWGKVDPEYHCVCVEHTDFAPILFEDMLKRIEAEGGKIGFQERRGNR